MSRGYDRKDPEHRRARLTGQYEQFLSEYARTVDYATNLRDAIEDKLTPKAASKAIPLTQEFIDKLQKARFELDFFISSLVGQKATMERIRAALVSNKLRSIRREINILRERLSKLSETTFNTIRSLKLKIKHVFDIRSNRLSLSKGKKFLKGMMMLFCAVSVLASPIKKVEKSDFLQYMQNSTTLSSSGGPGGSGTGPEPLGGTIGPPPVAEHNPFGDLLDLLKDLQKLGEGFAKDLLKEGSDHETLYVKMEETRNGDLIRNILRPFQPSSTNEVQIGSSNE